MTQSINTTITSALTEAGVGEYDQQSYKSYIEAVEKAVTEREYQITDELLVIAGQYGSFSESDVKNELATRTGLSFRPVVVPEPEVEEEAEVDLEAEVSGKKKGKKGKRVNELEEKVDNLAASVAQLVQLANRHLGASL